MFTCELIISRERSFVYNDGPEARSFSSAAREYGQITGAVRIVAFALVTAIPCIRGQAHSPMQLGLLDFYLI